MDPCRLVLCPAPGRAPLPSCDTSGWLPAAAWCQLRTRNQSSLLDIFMFFLISHLVQKTIFTHIFTGLTAVIRGAMDLVTARCWAWKEGMRASAPRSLMAASTLPEENCVLKGPFPIGAPRARVPSRGNLWRAQGRGQRRNSCRSPAHLEGPCCRGAPSSGRAQALYRARQRGGHHHKT